MYMRSMRCIRLSSLCKIRRPLEVALSGVDGLDLVLRAVDRVRARSTKANDGGVGEGERVVLEQVQRDRTCVTVSADEPPPDEERLRANPRVAYTLSVRPPSEGMSRRLSKRPSTRGASTKNATAPYS